MTEEKELEQLNWESNWESKYLECQRSLEASRLELKLLKGSIEAASATEVNTKIIPKFNRLLERVERLEHKNKLVKGLDFIKDYSSVWTQLGLVILFILAAMGYITIPAVTFKTLG